ncbi:hypothetical protein EV2_022931 [Malus domestica]
MGEVVLVEVSRSTSGSNVIVGEDGTAVPATGSVGSDAVSVSWASTIATAGSATGLTNSGSGRSMVAAMVQTCSSCSVSPEDEGWKKPESSTSQTQKK